MELNYENLNEQLRGLSHSDKSEITMYDFPQWLKMLKPGSECSKLISAILLLSFYNGLSTFSTNLTLSISFSPSSLQFTYYCLDRWRCVIDVEGHFQSRKRIEWCWFFIKTNEFSWNGIGFADFFWCVWRGWAKLWLFNKISWKSCGYLYLRKLDLNLMIFCN